MLKSVNIEPCRVCLRLQKAFPSSPPPIRSLASSAIPNYYTVLGVPKSATQSEIKDAYVKKSKLLHPDVNPGSHAEFVKLNEAYQALRSSSGRREYDRVQSYSTREHDPWRNHDYRKGPLYYEYTDPQTGYRKWGTYGFDQYQQHYGFQQQQQWEQARKREEERRKKQGMPDIDPTGDIPDAHSRITYIYLAFFLFMFTLSILTTKTQEDKRSHRWDEERLRLIQMHRNQEAQRRKNNPDSSY